MEKLEYIVPCHFGLEAVLKREITDLGLEITCVEDGRVTFAGDRQALCRANIFLRSAQRVLVKLGSFHAETFEELFQGTKALPWEAYIPKDGKFWVAKAASVKSRLFSPSDIQSIMKKAMVERMKSVYHIDWFAESGADAKDIDRLTEKLLAGKGTEGNYVKLRAEDVKSIYRSVCEERS